MNTSIYFQLLNSIKKIVLYIVVQSKVSLILDILKSTKRILAFKFKFICFIRVTLVIAIRNCKAHPFSCIVFAITIIVLLLVCSFRFFLQKLYKYIIPQAVIKAVIIFLLIESHSSSTAFIRLIDIGFIRMYFY